MESTQSLHHEASQCTLSVHLEPKQESISTATPLLDLNDATLIPRGWPTSPSRIKNPLSTMLLHGAFDIALFSLSSCFLVFSLVVMSYDGEPTSENPTATSVLIRATKYVSVHARHLKRLRTNMATRVLPSSRSSSLPSWGEQPTQYFSGA